MKIAIQNSKIGFHPRWIKYCESNNIAYKIVDCYANDIIEQLKDCDALMWQFHHFNPKDNLIAKQILFALEHTGFIVFPSFKTSWHFDDKIGQKYLFESIDAPLVPSYLFFDRINALHWANQSAFPKVFKLRGGAGSNNVKLIPDVKEAIRIINKAFSKGFPKYDAWGSLKERIYKYRKGKVGINEVFKGFARLFYKPEYARKSSNEVGYAYFQEFIPNNDSDIRIIVIGNRAFGLKRFVRDGDFRASGSGNFAWRRELFDIRCVKLSFELTEKLQLQVGAFDFVFDENNMPLVVEVSYGFVSQVYDPCEGYWDQNLNWHEGLTRKEDWMVELILNRIHDKD
jgi:glutathione synthase/RimK-type ligase-like ATP-grasp enzyme